MRTPPILVTCLALSVSFSSVAAAETIRTADVEDVEYSGATIGEVGRGGGARAKAKDWIIMPGGWFTFGGALTFITTTEDTIMGPRLKFTDVALIGISGRYSIKGKAEVFGGSAFLPKQPSFTDELVWQSSTLGARVGFGGRYAGWVSGGAGPMLGDIGKWGSVDAGIESRKSLHRSVVLQGSAGGSVTQLRFDDAARLDSRFSEAFVDGEIVFRDPWRSQFAGWFGTQFRFPVSSTSDLDPQTRLNVNVGGVLAYIDDWDLFLQYSIVDRGDMVAPETTLPILNGGFDQQQLIIGIARRFADKDNPMVPVMVAR